MSYSLVSNLAAHARAVGSGPLQVPDPVGLSAAPQAEMAPPTGVAVARVAAGDPGAAPELLVERPPCADAFFPIPDATVRPSVAHGARRGHRDPKNSTEDAVIVDRLNADCCTRRCLRRLSVEDGKAIIDFFRAASDRHRTNDFSARMKRFLSLMLVPAGEPDAPNHVVIGGVT